MHLPVGWIEDSSLEIPRHGARINGIQKVALYNLEGETATFVSQNFPGGFQICSKRLMEVFVNFYGDQLYRSCNADLEQAFKQRKSKGSRARPWI